MKIVDMHCDTLSALLSAKRQGKNFDFENSDTQISLSKMQAGDYLLQNFAIFVNLGETDSPLPEALEMILLFESEMEKHADLIRPVRSYADIEQNQADGVMSALLTGEEGEITMGNPDFLYFLYIHFHQLHHINYIYSHLHHIFLLNLIKFHTYLL